MKKTTDINRNLYKIPGGANYQLRSLNAIYISPSNSIRHELAKMIGGYMIRKWGDIKFNDLIVSDLKRLEKDVKDVMKGFEKQKGRFITEAVPKTSCFSLKGLPQDKDRRIDLVHLDTNDWYEFETNKKIKKEGSITIYV